MSDPSIDVDGEAPQGLYTPAMLAAAIEVPLSAIRRWERRGHLRATALKNRVSYFDFSEATVARRLAELLTASDSLTSVDRIVDSLQQAFPDLERPLVAAPFVIEGGQVLVREGETLAEPGGQRLIDFAPGSEDQELDDESAKVLSIASTDEHDDTRQLAAEQHDSGEIDEAIESLRFAMLETVASPEDHFTLGEWLYEAGQLEAARERFYAALEIDGDHVQARVNLACLLAESGQTELAVAAFRGTLEEHPCYADAHFHLAATLDRAGEKVAAADHYRRFLEIAPESPWALEAREKVEGARNS